MAKKKDGASTLSSRPKPEERTIGELPPPRKPVIVTVTQRGEKSVRFRVYGRMFSTVVASTEATLKAAS